MTKNRPFIGRPFSPAIATVFMWLIGGASAVTLSDLEKCEKEPSNDEILACFKTLTEKEKTKVADQLKEQAKSHSESDRNLKPDSKVCTEEDPNWTTCYVANLTNQKLLNKWSDKDTRHVITENMEASYVTARSGKRFEGDKTGGNLLYEGQIFTNLSWFEWKWNARNTKFWLDVPIRLGVRQLTDPSMPVRTPSYNPGIRLYFWPWDNAGDSSKGSTPNKELLYYSVGLHHYSNGQDGQSTLPDGSVNTRSGSFNTNYAEVAGHVVGDLGHFNWARLAFRQHLYGTFESFQRNEYEKRHLSLEVRTREYFKGDFPMHIKLTGTYGWGYDYIVKNSIDFTQNIAARTWDKFNTTAELIARPNFGKPDNPLNWKNLALYLRYDHGYDYYNINFQHRINRLQFGFVSTN